MIDAFVVSGLVIFVGCCVAIFMSRKVLSTTGRVLLWIATIAVLLVTVMRAERLREHEEAVWHPRAVDWTEGPRPIRIYWDRLTFLDYDRVFDDAVKVWNDRVSAGGGCRILARVPTRNDAQIVIRKYDGRKCGYETVTEAEIDEDDDSPAWGYYCNGYVDIQMKQLTGTPLAFRIALHEMGHGIGLTHDDVGAMSPKVMSPKSGDYPEYLLPSNKDVAAIRAKYCGQVDAQ